jgi:hypothetical protein
VDRKRRQIRLFKIVGSTTARLLGHLELFDIEAAPPYRALSYTWGDSAPTYIIVINEQTCTIRSNLSRFLKVYGARHFDEYIWIDQLCIDQSNNMERNHQVLLMPEIYQGATEVLIWLGPGKHHFQSSHGIQDSCCDLTCTEQHFRSDKCKWTIVLVQNDYWQRMWIVQEVLLARSLKIYCGRTILNWAEMREYILHNDRFNTPLQFWYLDKLVREGFCHSKFDLADAIRHCSKSGCQDPRDKVYALQGLLPENWRLQIDYNKQISMIFFEAVAGLLCHGYARYPHLYERQGRQDSFDWLVRWAPMLNLKDVLDAIWHLACEMGFRAVAEKRGINLGLNFNKLRPLIKAYDDAPSMSSRRVRCFESLVNEIENQFKE